MHDLIVVWRISSICNLGCQYCEYSKYKQRKRVNQDESEILRFSEVLYRFGLANNKEILISWLGGEPLLWKNIFTTSNYLKNKFGFKISATTNGTTLDSSSVVEGVISGFSEITISVDGLPSIHDKLRQERGLGNQILSNISNLRKQSRNIPLLIRVNTILHSKNIYDFETFCAKLAECGVDEVTFNQLITLPGSTLHDEYGLKPDHVDQLFKIYTSRDNIYRRYGIMICGGRKYHERIMAYTKGIKVPVQDCPQGNGMFFIDEYGNIGPCSFISFNCKKKISDLISIRDVEELKTKFQKTIINFQPSPCKDCMDSNTFGKFNRLDGFNNSWKDS